MTRPIPFDLVGFDLDGTLLDTSGDLTAAVNHALTSVGRPALAVEQVKPMVGGGARHMLKQGMEATGGCSDEELDRLTRVLLDYYEANIAVSTSPFPGVMAAIDAFQVRDIRVAIVSNKHERLCIKILDALDLTSRFSAVIGGDTMGPGRAKPDRAPIDEMIRRSGGSTAAFVGDSIYDVMAAHNAGIPAIAVSFGFLMQPVEELGADAIIDHYDELIPTLATLGPRP